MLTGEFWFKFQWRPSSSNFCGAPRRGRSAGGKRKRGGRAPPSDAERSDAEHRKAASPAYCMVLVGRSPGVTVEPL